LLKRFLRSSSVIIFSTLVLSLNGCTAAETENQDFNWTAVIMAVVLVVLVYFLLIRPQNKRRKDQQKILDELKPGDEVVTAAGLFGKIERIDNESLVLIVESGAKIRVLKQGILLKRDQYKQ